MAVISTFSPIKFDGIMYETEEEYEAAKEALGNWECAFTFGDNGSRRVYTGNGTGTLPTHDAVGNGSLARDTANHVTYEYDGVAKTWSTIDTSE